MFLLFIFAVIVNSLRSMIYVMIPQQTAIIASHGKNSHTPFVCKITDAADICPAIWNMAPDTFTPKRENFPVFFSRAITSTDNTIPVSENATEETLPVNADARSAFNTPKPRA